MMAFESAWLLPSHFLPVPFSMWVSAIASRKYSPTGKVCCASRRGDTHQKVCFCWKGAHCYSSLASMIISLSINHHHFKTFPVCFSGECSLGFWGGWAVTVLTHEALALPGLPQVPSRSTSLPRGPEWFSSCFHPVSESGCTSEAWTFQVVLQCPVCSCWCQIWVHFAMTGNICLCLSGKGEGGSQLLEILPCAGTVPGTSFILCSHPVRRCCHLHFTNG